MSSRSGRVGLSIAALSLSALAPLPALASPELRVEGRHFKDAAGRVVLLRGVNVAGDAKVPPFRPASDPAIFDPLRAFGLNVVRLLFTWEAYEPSKGTYDQSYLDYFTAAARAAWARGLFVIVDVHQDGFSRSSIGGCGDGFPAWAIPPSVTPAAPDNGPSCADWGVRMLKDDAMAASWSAFYEDQGGARTRFLAMLKSVAARLDPEPGVVGYDMLNEPWGDEATQIGPLYKDAGAAIREASPTAILFFEPRALVSAGAMTALPDPGLSNAAYAPHFYDASVLLFKSWSNTPPDEPFKNMVGAAEGFGVPLLVGELGAPAGTQGGDGYMNALYSRLDGALASATQWVYSPGWTPLAKDGWNDEDLSIVDGSGEARDNFRPRAYARRIGGAPTRLTVTAEGELASNFIELSWDSDPKTGQTELFVPTEAFFGAGQPVIDTSGEGLACSMSGPLVTCETAKAGPMRVRVRAALPPESAGACGLTGVEMLLLLPLYSIAARRRRAVPPLAREELSS